MNSRRDKLERLLEEALGLPSEERAAFLDRHCGSDQAMRREIEAALLLHDQDPNVLELETDEADDRDIAPHTVQEGASSLPENGDSLSGAVLGDYLVLEEIGRGGMGVVYRARDQKLKVDVALKVIPRGIGPGGVEEKRLRLEAQNVARLDHPGIVRIRTCDSAGAWTWFAMDLVPGLDLDQELEILRGFPPEHPGPFSPQLLSFQDPGYQTQAAELLASAADAVQHAHDQGIVHRDLKPKNMILGPNRSLRIVDFGIARPLGGPGVTESGALAGTVYYMSPEVAQSAKHPVDQRSDVYSLGVVLYELLTLKRPFEGKTSREVLDRILTGLSPLPSRLNPAVAPDLEAICLKAIAFDPGDRYPTAAALRDDLGRFLANQAVQARRPSVWRSLFFFLRRHRREIWAAGLVFLAAIGLGTWLYVRSAGAHRARWNIRSSGPRGTLELARLDDTLGEPGEFRKLGYAPLREVRLDAGFYRLRARFDTSVSVEYDLEAVDHEVRSIEVREPPSDRTVGMVFIAGGTMRLTRVGLTACTLDNRVVNVAPFWIDRTEVPNLDYQRFLDAHPDRAPPVFWPPVAQRPEGWERLPATGMSWEDAAACAAFLGKRLATHAEWEFAACGPAGRRFPWADSRTPKEVGANIGRARPDYEVNTPALQLRAYLSGALPVDQLPGAASPEGVLHLLGNVDEWVGSISHDPGPSGLKPARHARTTLGNWWQLLEHRDIHGTENLGQGHRRYYRGFRCVVGTP